jgi:hypothetical protein
MGPLVNAPQFEVNAVTGMGSGPKGASVRTKAGWTKKAAGVGGGTTTSMAETITKVTLP